MDDQSSTASTAVIDPFGFRKQQQQRVGSRRDVLTSAAKENRCSRPSTFNTPSLRSSSMLQQSLRERETPDTTTPLGSSLLRLINSSNNNNETTLLLDASHPQQTDDAFGATDKLYSESTSSRSRRRRPTLVSASSTAASSPLTTIYSPRHPTSLTPATSTTMQQQQRQDQPHPHRSAPTGTIISNDNRNASDAQTQNLHSYSHKNHTFVPPTPLKYQTDSAMAMIHTQVCASPSNTTISQLSVSPDARRVTPSLAGAVGSAGWKERLTRRDDLPSRMPHHSSAETLRDDEKPTTTSLPTVSSPAPSTASRLQQKRLYQVQSELNRANNDLLRLHEEAAAAMVHLEHETHQRLALENKLSALLAAQQERESQHECEQMALQQQQQQSSGPHAAELAEWETALQQQAAAIQRAREQVERREHDWNDLQEEMMLLEEEQHEHEARLVAWHTKLENAEQAYQTKVAKLQVDHERMQQEMRHESDDMASQQRRLIGTEQRLDAQALAIQERSQQLDAKEEELRQLDSRVRQDQRELESATQELDDTSKREQANYQRMQEALEQLVQQRRVEEDSVKRSLERRQEIEHEISNSKAESERVQHTMANQLREVQAELQRGKSQIAEQQRELSALLQRKQSALDADEARRRAVTAETAKADQNLTAVLQQLEVAQRERSAVVASVTGQRRDLESVQRHMVQEETRWHAENVALDEKIALLDKVRTSAEKDARDIIAAAEKHAADLSRQYHEQSQAMNRDRESQMDELNEAIRSYERDRDVMRQQNDAYQMDLQDFNKRVKEFGAVEGREKRLREELETKIKRLTALIQKERSEHIKEIQRCEQSIRIQQTESAQKLADLSQRLVTVESERDEKSMDNATLRHGLMERDQAIRSMQNDVKITREELANAHHQLKALQERESNQSFDLNQMKTFMERLEAQSSVLEQQENQCQQLRLDLEARENEYHERVNAMDQERQKMLLECNEQALHNQRDVLLTWLGKPWRGERESIGKAFSRWIRALVAEISGGVSRGLTEVTRQVKDLEAQVQKLDDRRDTAILEKVRTDLDREKSSRHNLDRELRAQRKKEQELYQEIERLSKDKERFRRESLAEKDNGNTAALDEREARIKQRELELDDMEKSIEEQERQIAEANERIRSMASALRQKESDLDHKEARLSASTFHNNRRNDEFSFDKEV